jgi:hypothetical protein
MPVIPCLACHQIHAPAADTHEGSFYDRRERVHYPARLLPPARLARDDGRVRVSPDPRQRVCMQCHATDSSHRLGSSDDRTPTGVHRGLSCADCHPAHGTAAAVTCGACHPADSHCGIPVERMDTTFLSASSSHNIHTVSCQDCHPDGVPGRTARTGRPAAAP